MDKSVTKGEFEMPLYKERDPEKLDQLGNFYSAHVNAMTEEGLHSKSAIAGELAHRDYVIAGMADRKCLNCYLDNNCTVQDAVSKLKIRQPFGCSIWEEKE